ncbi:MAG: tRNA pseudouridine synthase [Peptococcaceae bacterium]|jgi:tRNA pseudouridine55 synthase|nr:tRNA pseudouridine synthase [Peptococcaceae bacterium]
MDGLINVLKPPGMTSHDVVSFLRREFQQKKIGHAGTLDPQAAGVLPVCLGQATRLVEYLSHDHKEYLCELTLGITTTTQDAWGEVIEQCEASEIMLAKIKEVLSSFEGEVWQIPPMYSAIKLDGVPLYKLARKGEEIEREPRQVYIEKITLLDYRHPKLLLLVNCSKGTYIRTLCHDIGSALGAGGIMSFLLRTRVGNFTLEDSFTLEEIQEFKKGALLPLTYGIAGLPKIYLPDDHITRLKNGQTIPYIRELPAHESAAVLDEQRNFHVIVSIDNGMNGTCLLKPKKVFHLE